MSTSYRVFDSYCRCSFSPGSDGWWTITACRLLQIFGTSYRIVTILTKILELTDILNKIKHLLPLKIRRVANGGGGSAGGNRPPPLASMLKKKKSSTAIIHKIQLEYQKEFKFMVWISFQIIKSGSKFFNFCLVMIIQWRISQPLKIFEILCEF